MYMYITASFAFTSTFSWKFIHGLFLFLELVQLPQSFSRIIIFLLLDFSFKDWLVELLNLAHFY